MMRALCIVVSVLLHAVCSAGVCKGDDPCRACKDCSACKWCDPKNPKGGSCGTLRDQTAKQREAAQRKRK